MASLLGQDWKKLKVQQLREELGNRGLETAGSKLSLVQRLENYDKESHAGSSSTVTTDQVVSVNESSSAIQLEQNPELKENHVVEDKPATLETVVAGASKLADQSVNTVILNENPLADKEQAEAIIGGAQKVPKQPIVSPTEPSIPKDTVDPLSDFEKRQKRAERFGVELQMSEEEKRQLRAERFSSKGGKTLGKRPSFTSELEKKKVRAARFGVVIPSGTSVDEEAKKKARSERFGLEAKLVKNADAEKQKARSLRFAAGKKIQTEQIGTVATA